MDRWMSFGLMVVVVYPVTVGFLFMLTFMVHQYVYNEKANLIFERRRDYLYLIFLSIFFFFILSGFYGGIS